MSSLPRESSGLTGYQDGGGTTNTAITDLLRKLEKLDVSTDKKIEALYRDLMEREECIHERIDDLKRDTSAVRLIPFIQILSKENRANSCQVNT